MKKLKQIKEHLQLAWKVVFNNKEYEKGIDDLCKVAFANGQRVEQGKVSDFIDKMLKECHKADKFVGTYNQKGYDRMAFQQSIGVVGIDYFPEISHQPHFKAMMFSAQTMGVRTAINDKYERYVVINRVDDLINVVNKYKAEAVKELSRQLSDLVTVEIFEDDTTGMPAFEFRVNVYKGQ